MSEITYTKKDPETDLQFWWRELDRDSNADSPSHLSFDDNSAWKSHFQVTFDLDEAPTTEALRKLVRRRKIRIHNGQIHYGSSEELSFEIILKIGHPFELSGKYCETDSDFMGYSLEPQRLIDIKESFSTLEPLTVFKNLKYLDCMFSLVSSLQPLSDLKNLEFLNCCDTWVDSLEPLRTLKNLRYLIFCNTYVQNIEPLRRIKSLEALVFGFIRYEIEMTNGHDWTFDDCPYDEFVLASKNLSDLGPISDCTNLKYLYFENTNVTDLDAIHGLIKLRLLGISNSRIEDLGGVENLQYLQSLFGSNSQILNLKPISKLIQLRVLDLSNTPIESLEHLTSLDNLRKLNISNTKICDLKPLSGLGRLESIDVSGTRITSLKSISSLSSLKYLKCEDTKLPIDELLQFQKRHPKCSVIA